MKRNAAIAIIFLLVSISILASCSMGPGAEAASDFSDSTTDSSDVSVQNSGANQPGVDYSAPAAEPIDEPPLQEADWAIAVPDFLTEEQKLLYRRAHNLYNLFVGESASVDSYPMPDGSSPAFDPIKGKINGTEYYMAQGRYHNWDTFYRMIRSIYTDELFETLNQNAGGNAIFVEQNGTLFYLDTTYIMDSGKLQKDSFELVSQTDDEIIFTVSDQFLDEITGSVETQSGFVVMRYEDGKWLVDEFEYPK